MTTSNKLRAVFENIRPHINGHRTDISAFVEAINEVAEMEAKIIAFNLPVMRSGCPHPTEYRNFNNDGTPYCQVCNSDI